MDRKQLHVNKAKQPTLPFIVHECENAIPCVTARYEWGREEKFFAENFDEQQVTEAVQKLCN